MTSNTLIMAIIIFGALIIVHELGHFAVAKMVGIKVHEFSIGLGPSLLSFRRGETIYSLRLFPVGGYNKMAGMESGDEDERGFNTKPVRHRMAVIIAGSLMNFALGIFLFVTVFKGLGIPSNEAAIGKVQPGKPAAQAGLLAGDRIERVAGQPVETWGDLVASIHRYPGQTITVQIVRGGQRLEFQVTPQLDPQANIGLIGIQPVYKKMGVWEAVTNGLKQAVAVALLILGSLVQMITGRVPPEFAGPLGIVQMVHEAASLGLVNVLNFAGLLSLNLGLINLFPIPALDGSRLVFLGIEGIRGKPVDPQRENFIHLVGFAVLILLMVIITYKDILRILGG